MKQDQRHHLLDRVNNFCTSMAEVETATDHADEGTQRRPRRTTRMTTKRKAAVEYRDKDAKKRRTFGDFFMFCNFVLEYEEKLATAESYSRASNDVNPGMNSAGESSASTSPTSSESSSLGSEGSDRDNGASSGTDSSSSEDDDSTNEKLEYTSDDDSWNLVTCFCRRPFAGRPMIECSKCQTWVHLYCAKIKKDHVPDTYFCPKCSASSGVRSRS